MHPIVTELEKNNIDKIKLGIFDIDGVMRGKYINMNKFISAIDKGFGFCDVVFGWDIADELYDKPSVTGWHTGYPDATVRILPESCREIPWEDNMLFFLGEFDGQHELVCPRAVLRKIINKAKNSKKSTPRFVFICSPVVCVFKSDQRVKHWT